ncbi:MAG: cell division protein FtsA [bacterium]|nr:cell division protein FtsA [bacterium]
MAREHIITALDLGSHKIRVGTLLVGEDLKVIGFGESLSRGIRRGQIIDSKEAIESIREAVEIASKSGNVKITRLSVGLSGPHFKLMNSHGSIAVSRADGEISVDDVNRVLDSARTIPLPSNREIIHTIPVSYTIDGIDKAKDPLGMKGVRLEVDSILVLGSTPVLRSVRKAIHDAGLELENIVYSPLAVSRAVLTKKQRELGVAVVDIGVGTTGVSIWEESELKHAGVVPMGSGSITNDMAVGLKVAHEVSERIKLEHACCVSSNVSRREQIILADWTNNDAVIPKWELARIVEPRVSEIFELINDEIKKSGKPNLPAGVVLTGGGVKMDGLMELARKKLKLNIEIGRAREIKTDFSELFSPETATLAGILLYENDNELIKKDRPKTTMESLPGNGLWSKIKEWFSELIP